MTYLQLVNAVLLRLREDDTATVATSDYSALIGKYVNDTKRQVEDAWKWEALYTTLTIPTAAATSTLTLTGIGLRHKDVTINNTTLRGEMQNVPRQWILDQQQLATITSGQPAYYAWAGNNGTDSKIEIFPTPDGIYSLKINGYVPQVDLSADADILTIQSEAVIAGAYARAVVERGESGGLDSSEAYALYKGILSDQIALEAHRNSENEVWVAC